MSLDKEKQLEEVLQSLYIARLSMNHERVVEILKAIDDYCYACGGGEYSEEEIENRISKAYDALMKIIEEKK